jgi:hypothetical protein
VLAVDRCRRCGFDHRAEAATMPARRSGEERRPCAVNSEESCRGPLPSSSSSAH